MFWMAINASLKFKFKKAMEAIDKAVEKLDHGLQTLEISQGRVNMHLIHLFVVMKTKQILLRASMLHLRLKGVNLF